MIDPYYLDRTKEQIPVVIKDGVYARVVSGEVFGQKGSLNDFRTEVDYIDFTTEKKTSFTKPIKIGWNTFIMIWKGSLKVQGKQFSAGQAVFFERDKNQEVLVEIESQEDCGFVWIAGLPLNEPIYQHGPFVMTQQKDIYQAIDDF